MKATRLTAALLGAALLLGDCRTISSEPPGLEAPSSLPAESSSSAGSIAEEDSRPFGYDRLDAVGRQVYDLLDSGEVTPERPYRFDAPQDYESVIAGLTIWDLTHQTGNWCRTAHYLPELTPETYEKGDLSCSVDHLYCYPPFEEGQALPGWVQLPGEGIVIGLQAERLRDPTTPEYTERERLFEAASAELLARLPVSGSGEEKARAIAELLCEWVVYGPNNDCFDEYGAVVLGEAVCEGYAKAFQYFADRCGLRCITITGVASLSDESHGWNMVELDGSWRHVDVTWMDQADGVHWEYFLATDEEIERDHKDLAWGLTAPGPIYELPRAE